MPDQGPVTLKDINPKNEEPEEYNARGPGDRDDKPAVPAALTPSGSSGIGPQFTEPEKYNAQGQGDRRRHFQTVMKHTRYTQVDVGTHRYPLRMLFGQDVDFALCAYNPRFERIPKPAAVKHMFMRVACLTPAGDLALSEWAQRSPSV